MNKTFVHLGKGEVNPLVSSLVSETQKSSHRHWTGSRKLIFQVLCWVFGLRLVFQSTRV